MSSELPSREQAIKLLQQTHCPKQVITHCLTVANFAVEIAKQLKNKGFQINIQLVEAGAILHDIGRSKTHKVNHSVVGAQIAESLGLPEELVNVIRRHVGAGVTILYVAFSDDAKMLYHPYCNFP